MIARLVISYELANQRLGNVRLNLKIEDCALLRCGDAGLFGGSQGVGASHGTLCEEEW